MTGLATAPAVASPAARRLLADVLPAVVVALLALPQIVFHARTDPAGLPAVLGLSLLLVVPLLWRRTRPVATFRIVAAVAAVQWVVGVPLVADVAVLIALFTVAVAAPRPAVVVATAAGVLGSGLAAMRWPHGLTWPEMALVLVAFVVAAVMSGLTVRNHWRMVQALHRQADQLRRERDQQAAIAAADERARIARELHDIVAHSVAVMITLADAAALRAATDPARAADAMRQVAATGRTAMGEARTVLGVLRADPEASRRPPPGLADLPDLAAVAGRSGITVTATIGGDISTVPAGLGVTIYRMAQEAITNALRHAAGATAVAVRVAVDGGRLTLVVDDDGRPEPDTAPAPDAGPKPGKVAGFGLRGMTERAGAFGGQVDAGPGPDGGWRVTASFPLPPAPACGGATSVGPA